MQTLSNLTNTHRKNPRRKRVGRGVGSGLGKTCGRGHKGQGSRSGARSRMWKEGGQMALHMKLPKRGFSQVRFQKKVDAINLGQISEMYQDGEVVNLVTLREKGYISGTSYGVKVLAEGEIDKKVTIEANAFSAGARQKLENAKIVYTQVSS